VRNLAQVAQDHGCGRGIELRVVLSVQINIARLDAEHVDDVGSPANRVPPKQHARLRADELRRLAKRLSPTCAIENRVVDFTDKRRNMLWIRHCDPPLKKASSETHGCALVVGTYRSSQPRDVLVITRRAKMVPLAVLRSTPMPVGLQHNRLGTQHS